MISNNSYPWYLQTLIILISGSVVQYSVYYGQGQDFLLEVFIRDFTGNFFSWTFTLGFFTWALLWVKLTFNVEKKPEKIFGISSSHWGTDFTHYVTTLSVFFLLQIFNPLISIKIYENFPQILASFNVLTDLLTIWLFANRKKGSKKFWLSKILNGTDFNPQFFGVDLKNLIQSRMAMMGCQIFISSFYVVGTVKNGFNVPCFINFLIQSIYLAKYFWAESSNYPALDINSASDTVGFFYCYGTLVVLPAIFTFPVAYSIVKPPTISTLISVLSGIFGLICILIANYEHYDFRTINGYEHESEKPTNPRRKIKSNGILTSNFKISARNIDFTLQFGIYLIFHFSLGIHDRLWSFVNLFFVGLIFIGSANRREKIFRNRYGTDWENFCKKVPYKFIPLIF